MLSKFVQERNNSDYYAKTGDNTFLIAEHELAAMDLMNVIVPPNPNANVAINVVKDT